MIMFKSNRSFRAFQVFLKSQLTKYFAVPILMNTVIGYAEIIYKVFITDLSPIRDILSPTYNPRGETPWDPVCLFRSYWLMCQYGENGSITAWVKTLKSEPFWAILSGFTPLDTPGVGTFYAFEDRLCDFDKGQRVERTQHMRKPHSKPNHKLKKNEKNPPKHPDIVRRLVERVLRDEDQSQPERPDTSLQRIFRDCFVRPSAQRGLLGDPQSLTVSGDGMVFTTGGSPYGTKDCDCFKRGIFTCSCPRRFSDPGANWGWDSHRECYVYGYANYTFTAADSPHDLPIYSTLAQASRHDSVSHTYALFRMCSLYPEFTIAADILDSAHDNYATYELLDHWHIEPFIILNKTNTGHTRYTACEITIEKQGTPVCKCGETMCYWGADPKRYRHKWRCPHVVKKSVDCPYYNRPEGDYGRTFYTKSSDDIRLFTPTPRGTTKWKTTMKKRTSSERRNSQVKSAYHLEADRVRSKSRWLIRTVMRDAAMHVKAWVSTCNARKWVHSWFEGQPSAA